MGIALLSFVILLWVLLTLQNFTAKVILLYNFICNMFFHFIYLFFCLSFIYSFKG